METSVEKENGTGGKQKNTGKRRLSGRREYHASGGGKAVFFRTQNAWGTTNALFYFLGRGGGWAAVKLVLQLFTHLPPPQVLPSGKTC